MFVGEFLFCEGEIEFAKTLKRIKEQRNYKIELTIVNSLSAVNYVSKEVSEDIGKTSFFSRTRNGKLKNKQ